MLFLIDVMSRLALPKDHPDREPDQVQLANSVGPYDIHSIDDLIPLDGDIRVILSRQELLISPANFQFIKIWYQDTNK